ncbi:MAG: hypothetical protein ACFFB0_22510 [Promethearchaeota archaeon]
MKDLTINLDDKVVKALQNKLAIYEAEISELKEDMGKKDEEITNLNNLNDGLNSDLENVREKLFSFENKSGDLEKLDSEVYDLKKTITIQNEELKKIKAELDESKPKVVELTKNNEELKNIITENEDKIKELKDALTEKEKAFDEQKSRLEKAEADLSALQPTAPTDYTSEERLICPSCGARGKELKVEEDKSKVLSYVGHSPLYAKVNVCKKCGYKF